MPKETSHSEFGTLKSLIMSRPEQAFENEAFVAQEWKSLNFLEEPNFQKAVEEYQRLVSFIQTTQTDIQFLPSSSKVSLDAVYCRDSSIVTDFGVIVCNMGKEKRMYEPELARSFYASHNVPILGSIQSPGTIEGGDVAWLDDKTLAVGHTYRTNYEGIRQLKHLLEPNGIEVIVAEMPHNKGKSDVFHLMSVFSPIDKRKAVVYSPLMPIHFREHLLDQGFQLIEVPDEEFESMGCNVLAISPGKCILVDGNPITKARIADAGCEVFTYEGNEISVKGGGGPTCLTRPVLREI